MKPIQIFISHSSLDKELAAALVQLLRSSLNVSAERVRCTSVDGYRLPPGANVDQHLRSEVFDAQVFIALLTPDSLTSTYVLFELGARWGSGKNYIPLLALGAEVADMHGPMASLNALHCDETGLFELVNNVGEFLGTPQEAAHVYRNDVARAVDTAKRLEMSQIPLAVQLGPFMVGHTRPAVPSPQAPDATHIVIPVWLTNESTLPITIDYFTLTARINGRQVIFHQIQIPRVDEWRSEVEDISLPRAQERDIWNYMDSLMPGQTITGYMMFIAPNEHLYKEKSSDIDLQFTCTDIRGRSYRVATIDGRTGPLRKLGAYFRPKQISPQSEKNAENPTDRGSEP